MLRAQPARLLSTDKRARGARLVLLGLKEATVGSAEGSTLRLSASRVAENHALIRRTRGRYYLIDFKASHGTRINGSAVRRRYRLKHGDQISFGKAEPYRFIDPDGAKRVRNRRIISVAAVAAVTACAIAAHLSGLDGGALSPAPIEEFVRSNLPTLEHPAPHAVVAKSAEPKLRVAARPTEIKRATLKPGAIKRAVVKPRAIPASSELRSRPARFRKASAKLAATTNASPAKVLSNSSAAPSPSASVTVSHGGPWLERLNYYRAMAGLPALKKDPKLSASVAAHAHYLMVNFGDKIRDGEPLGALGQEEDPSKTGYSAAGSKVAANAQIAWGCGIHDLSSQIDHWLAGPLARLAMLSPLITEAGFGEARSNGCWVAGLRLPPGPEEVKPYAHAVEFPPGGATISLRWRGLDSPNPLTACPGYTAPVGLPITLQLGYLINPKLGAYSLRQNGHVVKSCAYDAHGYNNPIPTAQEYGRWVLRREGAVVLIPRAPLKSGAQYSVSITARGHVYAWSFRMGQ